MEENMSLKVKQLIVALLSVAIVIVLSYVIYSEKEHRLEEKRLLSRRNQLDVSGAMAMKISRVNLAETLEL